MQLPRYSEEGLPEAITDPDRGTVVKWDIREPIPRWPDPDWPGTGAHAIFTLALISPAGA